MKNETSNLLSILEGGQATTDQALELFDRLAAVDLEFMIGRWQGRGLPTNHPMDGWLEALNWYGKEFIDTEQVHPLLFRSVQNSIIKVAPQASLMLWALRLPVLKQPFFKLALALGTRLLKTDRSQARLRMMAHRGALTATMIYDYLPINDYFRRVDSQTVLGVMDFKPISQPFFFLLRRCPPASPLVAR